VNFAVRLPAGLTELVPTDRTSPYSKGNERIIKNLEKPELASIAKAFDPE
jgi:hypothetical protein